MESYYDHIDEPGEVALVLLNHRDEATRHVTTLANLAGQIAATRSLSRWRSSARPLIPFRA